MGTCWSADSWQGIPRKLYVSRVGRDAEFVLDCPQCPVATGREVAKLMMGVSRTRSAGAKVTDEEYAQLEALAQTRGLTVGEWCRDVLLSQLGSEERRVGKECRSRW